jgi:hypothetical protein
MCPSRFEVKAVHGRLQTAWAKRKIRIEAIAVRSMKTWLFRIAALGIGLAAALAMCELALRLWAPSWLHQRMAELGAGGFQASPLELLLRSAH